MTKAQNNCTTVTILKTTLARLKKNARKDETYDDFINRVLDQGKFS